jgi:large subunit ribosomal protein L21e
MPHAFGYRSGTRHKFKKPFGRRGAIRISKILTAYRIGDYVDIIVDGAIHKGMPYSFYHGRTGRVFNVNPRAIGVIVNKQVRNRIIQKRIHVRVEHIRQSTSRLAWLKRITQADQRKHEANKAGKRISTKRLPTQPRDAHVIKGDAKFQHIQMFTETW